MYKNLKKDLIKNNFQLEYDVDSIFSVTTKKKSKLGYQTDSRMIRNSLAHFDYIIEWKKDSFDITFNNPYSSTDSMSLTDTEFAKFIETHRYLMQSIFATHIVMMTFSTLRHYFAID